MKNYIIVNETIFETYKDEVIGLSPRLFTSPYFYNLNAYVDPIDLTGLSNYLKYNEEIIIFATSSFIDFVNIVLILDFLQRNDYKKDVVVKYYVPRSKILEKDMLILKRIKVDDYNVIGGVVDSLKNNKKISVNNYFLPGMINYISFFNTLVDPSLLVKLLENELDDFEQESIVNYLETKYQNMGLNKEFFVNYVKENIKINEF